LLPLPEQEMLLTRLKIGQALLPKRRGEKRFLEIFILEMSILQGDNLQFCLKNLIV